MTKPNANGQLPRSNRIFACVMPTGLWWSDKAREEHGDYARLAVLNFSNLELEIFPGCPKDFAEHIRVSARDLQAKRGESFQISASGQTITLGYALEK